MQEKLPFTKIQSIGNDYICINGFKEHIVKLDELAKKITDRHYGIGADGLLIILPSALADIRIKVFNNDGCETKPCGNVTHCAAKFAYSLGIIKNNTIKLETISGTKILHLLIESDLVISATLDIGSPIFTPEKIPVIIDPALSNNSDNSKFIAQSVEIGNKTYSLTALNLSETHAIVFVQNIADIDIEELGKLIENHRIFPQKANVEFVEVVSPEKIKVRIWEKEIGSTLTHDTCACAAAIASNLNGYTNLSVDVSLPRGTLHVNWDPKNNNVYMTGSTEIICEGNYFL